MYLLLSGWRFRSELVLFDVVAEVLQIAERRYFILLEGGQFWEQFGEVKVEVGGSLGQQASTLLSE